MSSNNLGKGSVQFDSADIGKKEKTEYFTKLKESPKKKISAWFKQKKKKIIIASVSVLGVIVLAVGGIIAYDIINAPPEPEFENQVVMDLHADVWRFVAGEYDGTFESLVGRIEDYIQNETDKRKVASAVIVLAGLYVDEWRYTEAIELLRNALDTINDDAGEVTILIFLVRVYRQLDDTGSMVRSLEQLVSYPNEGIELFDQDWPSTKALFQEMLNEISRGQEE